MQAAAALQVLPETLLKDGGEGKSSQLTELEAVPLAVHFAWKEQVPEVRVYIDLWAVAKDLADWSKTRKECNRKIGDRKVLGRETRMDLLKGQRL